MATKIKTVKKEAPVKKQLPAVTKKNVLEKGKDSTAIAYEDMLKQFNNIPRKKSADSSVKSDLKETEDNMQMDGTAKNMREQKAIKDMRRLLVFLEKSIVGKIEEKDLQEIQDNTEQWLKSIDVLRNYIEVSGMK